MAYRELRNFTEIMRTLGYPRLISMEHFRQCNFPLVAEILVWLVERYDPKAALPTDVDTEQDRVIFIKAVAEFMATKASVKLNAKKLYRADGGVVRELLKVVSLLYGAMKGNAGAEAGAEPVSATAFDLGPNKLAELKQVRALATEITTRGAALYDLLAAEPSLREERMQAVARPLELETIEKGVRQSREAVVAQLQKLQGMMDNLAGDEKGLAEKIEKKKADLDRNQKRLKSLQSVRPAFMDEFEKIEEELQRQYQVYVEKFRNLSYLENELEQHYNEEQEKFAETEESLKRMQIRLREEDVDGDFDVYDDPDGGPDSESDDAPRGAGKAKGGKGAEGAVFGSMHGGDDDLSDDTGSDLDSGSEGEDGNSLGDEGGDDDLSDNDF